MSTVTTATARPRYGTVEYFVELLTMGHMPESVRPPLSAATVDHMTLALVEDVALDPSLDEEFPDAITHVRNLLAAAKQVRDELAAGR